MKLLIKNARLSFSSLFKPRAFQEGGDATYRANLILNKREDAATIASIRAAMKSLAVAENKGVLPAPDKLCLRDGTTKVDGEGNPIDGYGPDTMFVSASNRRPIFVGRFGADRNIEPLTEQEGVIFDGCYVAATIELWFQNNKFGKRINAQLRAVTYLRDGKAFGASRVDPSNEFEGLEIPEDGDLEGSNLL